MHNEEHKEKAHHEGGEHASRKAKKSDSIRISKKMVVAILFVCAAVALAYVGKAYIFAMTVNGSPITRLEVMRGLEKASGKQYAESLVAEKLIMQEAQRVGISVTADDITAEFARIEASVVAQGATMDMLLSSQGITVDMLRKQIGLKKTLELLLADKVAVTDADVDAYITESKVVIPEEQMAEARKNITEQLRGQKLNAEAPAYVEGLRLSARIVYFGNYITTTPAPAPSPTPTPEPAR